MVKRAAAAVCMLSLTACMSGESAPIERRTEVLDFITAQDRQVRAVVFTPEGAAVTFEEDGVIFLEDVFDGSATPRTEDLVVPATWSSDAPGLEAALDGLAAQGVECFAADWYSASVQPLTPASYLTDGSCEGFEGRWLNGEPMRVLEPHWEADTLIAVLAEIDAVTGGAPVAEVTLSQAQVHVDLGTGFARGECVLVWFRSLGTGPVTTDSQCWPSQQESDLDLSAISAEDLAAAIEEATAQARTTADGANISRRDG